MKKRQKTAEDDLIATGLAMFALFYLLPSLIAFLTGLMDANSIFRKDCNPKWSKIEYVYPAYKLGCYLGERPNE